MSQQLTGEQIISISNKVMRYVRKCNLVGVKSKLDPLKMPHRKRIASRKIQGFTALFLAVSYNNLELVQYLLQECNVPVDQPVIYNDDAQVTPLLVAASERCKNMLQILLDYGADINVKDHLGSTALKMSVKGGNVDIVKFLIERGSDVNFADHKGVTPLMESVFNTELVDLLSSNGANLYATDAKGDTVLHFAACKGSLEVFKFLLQKGFSPYTCNGLGENCFRLAATHWQWRILIYLLVTFPYPQHSPQQYFDSTTTQIFIKALDEAEHNIDVFEFPALMVTEKVLGVCCTSLEALGYAAWLQCDLGNVSLAWDIYCHLLRACQRMRCVTGPDIVTLELEVFWKIYSKDQHYSMPFREVINLVRQIASDIVINWESLQNSNCEERSLKSSYKVNAWETLLLFVVNLLKILIHYQHKWDSVSFQRFSCSVLDRYTKVLSQTEQSHAEQEGITDGSKPAISLRLHGKWQPTDIILQACHETQNQFLGKFLKESPYIVFDAAKLVPVKEPLSLQCLTARVLNQANIEYHKYLPGRLTDFVLHHLS
ncbi:protein fem-1 homolog C-like [Octopus vulgaris]|uniref:Protein fem-1 homolog C-like n=1 Tax=Octopus vulgaris TaxID=6645 RepID=A0AA36BFF0_OCTVU|nr:protein fem-1 homolog C-like [Octopus vulgaris]